MALDVYSYASGNVTSSAYVTLDPSISTSVSSLLIVDTSTQLIKIAYGAAGSETDIAAFQGNGNPVSIKVYLPKGTRLALKAISTSATTGYNLTSLISS